MRLIIQRTLNVLVGFSIVMIATKVDSFVAIVIISNIRKKRRQNNRNGAIELAFDCVA